LLRAAHAVGLTLRVELVGHNEEEPPRITVVQ
jgi:hypothetical protein